MVGEHTGGNSTFWGSAWLEQGGVAGIKNWAEVRSLVTLNISLEVLRKSGKILFMFLVPNNQYWSHIRKRQIRQNQRPDKIKELSRSEK